MVLRPTNTEGVVQIPSTLEPNAPVVEARVPKALADLAEPTTAGARLSASDVNTLVLQWAARLQVNVKRVQVREMRSKWGSISTAGILTLASDVLWLPPDLTEYIVVHELMHLRYANHQQGWRAFMGAYLSDWRERDQRLRGYRVVDAKNTDGV